MESWDNVYEREIENFDDFGDIGEIWFGEDSVANMIDWIESNIQNTDIKIIDLGCGNGHILFELSELGYTNLTGVDYSASSINLAKKIHAAKYRDAEISFEPLDFMPFSAINPPPASYNAAFQLAVDKGTFDAISLASGTDTVIIAPNDSDNDEHGHLASHAVSASLAFDRTKVAQKYAEAISIILGDGGILLITSCNWTEIELVDGFKDC
ncbi:hypothetical protein HK100_010692 [Physocladia obscura]|uniref:Methyltransferase domain-containing protein n=1 Tax=Physocladia obscura TaxID=109957 RepID=A0AAD5XMX9_9FUNG|nr:hypothetical protein HK100_010692 [Physocladia obscura]